MASERLTILLLGPSKSWGYTCACTATHGFCSAGDLTWSLLHARQVLSPLSYTLSPLPTILLKIPYSVSC